LMKSVNYHVPGSEQLPKICGRSTNPTTLDGEFSSPCIFGMKLELVAFYLVEA